MLCKVCRSITGSLLWVLLAGLMLAGSTVSAQNKSGQQLTDLLNSVSDTITPFHLSIYKDGQPIYLYSSQPDVNAGTRYRVASASKWLVSATILALVDKGFLKLDDPVSKYLESFKGDKAAITIRQLLTHTSGLPSSSIYIKSDKYTLQQSVDSIGYRAPLDNLPGSTFNYGSVSFQVAARVAEVVTHKNWETVFNYYIAKPCGMINTDFGNKDILDIGDGGYSTAADYLRFMEMIRNMGQIHGRQVLTEKSIHEMMLNQVGAIPMGYSPFRLRSSQNSRFYGLGVWLDRVTVDENASTEINSQGGRGFTPWVNTCKGISAVWSTYGQVEQVQIIIDSVRRIVDDWFPDDCKDVAAADILIPPANFTLEQNSGNENSISFSLNKESEVLIRLFDPLGNEIATIYKGMLPFGRHDLPIYVQGLKAGVYFYELTVGDHSVTKKLNIKVP